MRPLPRDLQNPPNFSNMLKIREEWLQWEKAVEGWNAAIALRESPADPVPLTCLEHPLKAEATAGLRLLK